MRAKVHTADIQDRAGVPLLLEGVADLFPSIEHLWVDQGYTGSGKSWIEEHLGWRRSLPDCFDTGLDRIYFVSMRRAVERHNRRAYTTPVGLTNVTTTSSEQALLVLLKFSDNAFGTPKERQDFHTLEDRVANAITEQDEAVRALFDRGAKYAKVVKGLGFEAPRAIEQLKIRELTRRAVGRSGAAAASAHRHRYRPRLWRWVLCATPWR